MADQSVLARLLLQSPLFAGLGQHELEMVLARCRRERRPAGYVLFTEGESGHCLYVVVSGSVKVERLADRGAARVYRASRGPGEHVGEMAVVEDAPRSATATTETDCELLVLDRDDFRHCLSKSHQLALNLIHLLTSRLREAAAMLEARQRLDVNGRLCRMLLEMAETAGEALPDGAVRIGTSMDQTEIAARIGSTRETVNRVMNRLRKIGAVRQTDHALVICPDVLRRYIG
jgi:CRP-like cAMP-binding protein